MRQRQNARRLSGPRRPLRERKLKKKGGELRRSVLRGEGVRGNGAYGEDEVGHVAVAGNDLQAGDGIGVADDVSDAGGSVLLHPRDVVGVGGAGGGGGGGGGGGHGAWVGFALAPRESGGKSRTIVEGKFGELVASTENLRREGFCFASGVPRPSPPVSRLPWTAGINQIRMYSPRPNSAHPIDPAKIHSAVPPMFYCSEMHR